MAAAQETGIGSVGAPRAGCGRQRDAANQAKQRSESKPRPPSQRHVGAQAQPYRSHSGNSATSTVCGQGCRHHRRRVVLPAHRPATPVGHVPASGSCRGGIPGHPETPPRTSVTRPGSPRRSHGARIASRCGTTGITVARSHRRGCTSIPDLSRLPARSISAYAADLKPLSNADESKMVYRSWPGARHGAGVIIVRGTLRGRIALVAVRQGW